MIYVLIALVLLAVIIVSKSITIVSQSETMIIERLGRYQATLKPGVNRILDLLADMGIKTAVATASRPDHANGYLDMLGIHGKFERIICTSSVENGKPSPDVYLYACAQIGERPQDCLAVEDAPNGVRSAYAAGCRVAFVPDLTEADGEIRSKADVFSSLEELAECFDRLRVRCSRF